MNDSGINKTISVIGMHRSGTSCITGILAKLGLYTGKNISHLPTDRYNEQGYFENQSIVNANEELFNLELPKFYERLQELQISVNHELLFKQYGYIYGAWLSLEQSDIPDEKSIITTALKNFSPEVHMSHSWAIKDPRLSLNLHRWSKHIQIDAAIVMVRDPESVAMSLLNRDGMSPKLTADLYCLYNYLAFQQIKNIPSLIISYDQLLINPEQEITNITQFLAHYEFKIKSNTQECLDTITPSLNHGYKKELQYDDELMSIYRRILSSNEIPLNSGYYKLENIQHRLTDMLLELSCFQNKSNQLINSLQIDRIIQHPIAGNIIKLLRILKKDDSFGQFYN